MNFRPSVVSNNCYWSS